MRKLRCTLALLVGLVVAHVAPAQAQSTEPTRTPVSSAAIPAAITGGLFLAAGLALYVAPISSPGPTTSGWRGGILLDEPARDVLRLGTPDARGTAATVSDVLMAATMLNAVAIDAMAIPLARGDTDLAWQATSAYSLALGLTLTLGDLFKSSVGRARPYERECEQNPQAPGCGSANAYASFYSLHTAVAFTSAGFSCAMHLSRSLYGDAAADAGACGASLAAATMTGLLRIMADQHYLSDVVVGALIGFAIGYIVPLLLIPQRAAAPRIDRLDDDVGAAASPGPTAMVLPTFAPGPDGSLGTGTFGLGVSGTF